MNIRAVIWVVWLLLSVSSLSADWTVEQFVSYLRRPLAAPDRFVSDITIYHYPFVEISEAEMDEELGSVHVPKSWDMVEHINIIVDGSLVRQDVLRKSATEPPVKFTSFWDGHRQAIFWPDERSMIIESNPLPPNMLDVSLLFDQLYMRMTGEHLWLPLPEHGQRYVERVAETDDGILVTLRGSIRDDYAGTTWHMRFRSMEEPQLLGMQRFTPVVGSEVPVHMSYWDVQSWRDIGGGVIPDRARYLIRWRRTADNGKHVWYQRLIEFHRDSYRVPHDDESESLLSIPAEHGIRVANREMDIAYEIGGNYLRYGGTMYRLPTPVTEHVYYRVGEILEGADVIRETRTADSAAAEISGWRIEYALFFGIASAVVLFIVLRYKSKIGVPAKGGE